jgi:hypothetical protein
MANTISFKGDLLVGRSNYIDWVKRANLFLEINGFMPYIYNTEHTRDKSFYYKSNSDGQTTNKPYSPELAIRYIDKKAEFKRNQTKALGAIKSIITQDNVDRFKDIERFIGNALDVRLGVWHIATKGIILCWK